MMKLISATELHDAVWFKCKGVLQPCHMQLWTELWSTVRRTIRGQIEDSILLHIRQPL